jgi:hypothetical protein
MKTVLFTCIFVLLAATPCFAGSCPDAQNAANIAMQERNARFTETYNITMPDPEDTRGAFANCLSSIASIGDAFTLGISFPSMDQIVGSMCRQVDSLIQSKIQEVISEAKSSVPHIGGYNPFQVGGSASGISHAIIEKLK